MYGGDIRKHFLKGFASDWANNPLTVGAYSAVKPGCYGARELLSEPIAEKLIFAGEASKINADSANASCQKAFNALRLIVTIGWAIYPIGYVFGYLLESSNINAVNIIYNYADLINKTAFGLVIWAAAIKDSEASA